MDFIIKSDQSSATLRFFDFEDENLMVEVTGPSFSGRLKLWLYPDAEALANLFRQMAQNWRGWNDSISWETIEGEFTISARIDALGHVTLDIKLTDDHTKDENWSLKATLIVNAGQLDRLSNEAEVFFGTPRRYVG